MIKKVLQGFLILLAALLITIGINRGELQDIYYRVRLICLECIGIG